MNAEDSIEVYKPRAIDPERWNLIRPTVLAWVTNTLPCSARAAVCRMRITGVYASWCLDHDFPLEADVILTEDLIEAWFASGVSVNAKGTYRSHLRAVAKANALGAVWTPTPEPMRRTSLRSPYTEQDLRSYFTLVHQQSTLRRRRVFDLVLHLTLGFGLRAGELHSLRRDDIVVDDGLTLATLPDRTVPALTRYTPGITRLVDETEGTRIFGDHLGAHRRFDRLIESIEIPTYAPALRLRRLRTTWLVTVLPTLSLPEFQRISGLKSGRVLDDLVPFLPFDEDTYLQRAAGR